MMLEVNSGAILTNCWRMWNKKSGFAWSTVYRFTYDQKCKQGKEMENSTYMPLDNRRQTAGYITTLLFGPKPISIQNFRLCENFLHM